MSLELVNTSPGDILGGYKPGKPVHLGLRSTDKSVVLSTLDIDLSITAVQRSTARPDEDTALPATVELMAVERQQPEGEEVGIVSTAGGLSLSRGSSSEKERSIFEITAPVRPNDMVVGYFKLVVDPSWNRFSPTWIDKTSMVAPFMGVEHGGLNTGVYVFLRDNGAGGSVAISGPQPAPGDPRQGAVYPAFSWAGLPYGDILEFWICINPGSGKVTVWSSTGDGVPTTLVTTQGISSFGTFPNVSALTNNVRGGASTDSRLFVGNAGVFGDTVVFKDWALFPDYRQSVSNGQAMTGHGAIIRPDSPNVYDPRDKALPTELQVGPWLASGSDIGISLHYAPGDPNYPESLKISKSEYGSSYLYRNEPRLGTLTDGFMFEAYLKVDLGSLEGGLTGIGLRVYDGAKAYGFTLTSPDPATQSISFGGYTLNVNLSGYTLVRIVLDRGLSSVDLYISGILVASQLMSSFPASTETPHFRFGIVDNSSVVGSAYFRLVKYLPRYNAFEGRDGGKPQDGPNVFTLHSNDNLSPNSNTTSDGLVTVVKTDFEDPGLAYFNYWSKAFEFRENGGAFLEFAAKVSSYANYEGAEATPSVTNVGVKIHLGNKVFHIGFYECGAGGRKVAVMPGSGSVTDILNNTLLGVKFSFAVDWTAELRYRVEIRGWDSIKVWVENDTGNPAITIPWRNATDGFDLPADTGASDIEFGALPPDSAVYSASSTSVWRYIRWGLSNGFDVAVHQAYLAGYPSYLFGGRVLLVSEFDEA